jgi:hypothetical protein
MASVPVDPILEKPDWEFAIVVRRINRETLNNTSGFALARHRSYTEALRA